MAFKLQRYFGYTRILKTGAPSPLATITVYKPIGTLTLATLYADIGGTPLSNPFTSDASGFFYFYANPDEYDIKTTGTNTYTWGDAQVNVAPSDITQISTDLTALKARVDNALYRTFNVRDYGAKGDFVTDDTASFAACIAAAAAVSGNIYAPAGLYVNTAPVTLANSGNMTFYGESRDATQLIMGTKLTGTVTVANGSTTVVGSGTSFLSQLAVGDGVFIGGIMTDVVTAVTDNTHFTLANASAPSGSGLTAYKCGIAGNPAMTIGSQSYIQLRDFTIKGDCTGRNSAVNQVNGTHGILWSGAVGVCADIANVELVGFADHAMYVRGPTAPTTIRQCAISIVSGYGVFITDVTTQAPQDVTVEQTSIHRCFGGIKAAGCSSVDIIDCDIELSGFSSYPCINIDVGVSGNDTNGVNITNCSLSLSANPTPAAAVYMGAATYGNVISGGRSEVNGTAVASNLDIRGKNNVLMGGFYNNNAVGTGYFATTTGSNLFNVFIGCRILSSYAAGHDIVYDTTFPGARTTTIGVSGRQGAGFSMLDNAALANTVTASAGTPSTHKITTNIGGTTYYILATT